MKWIIAFSLFIIIIISTSFSVEPPMNEVKTFSIMEQDTTFDMAAAVANLKEAIKGREKEPASEVFKNLKMMGEFPAGRILAIMEFGYSGSLGVTCIHCHNPNDYASDEKNEKQIAREMSKMVSTINKDLLGSIANLKGDMAIVNCTTCHRGDVKPKLSMR